MADPTAPLDDWIRSLLASAAPQQRTALLRGIAAALRDSQARRIAAQRNPDGSAFEPRKGPSRIDPRGRVRSAMFERMRTPRHLHTTATADEAAVHIDGESGRIARVHQFGQLDRVRRGRGLTIRYPVRQLLGFTEDDRRATLAAVLEHLAP